MDRLDAMKVFIVALDAGSLAGASRALKRSPAAVSRAIALLENQVGVPLLHRTTRSMRLSPAGEHYAAACRRILADLEEAESVAAGERSAARGALTLSAPPIGGEEILQPILGDFLEAYPAVSARILLLDRHVNLTDEGVDLALRVGNLPDSSLVAVKVGSDVRRVIVGAPSYLKRLPPIEKPADLAEHQIIAMANFGLGSWTFPPAPGTAVSRTVPFTPRIEVNSVRAALSSAISGLGLTRLYSYHLGDKVADGALKIVLAQDEPAPQPVHLVVQPARMSTARVRAFLDYAVPRLRARFTQLADEARQMELRG